MPTLTVSELASIRVFLGNFSSSFTDEQLQTYAENAYTLNAETYLDGTVAIAFYGLMTGAVMFTDFTQGETKESQSKVYDRIERLYKLWSGKAGILGSKGARVKAIRQGYVHTDSDFTTDEYGVYTEW